MFKKNRGFSALLIGVGFAISLATNLTGQAQTTSGPGIPGAPAIPPGQFTLSIRNSAFGNALTDGNGRFLYMFNGDTSPTASSCLSANGCSTVWPPLVIQSGSIASISQGLQQSLVNSFIRSDNNQTQVTYNGHPLYYYLGDSNSPLPNGEGIKQFGSYFYLLDPTGNALTIPVIQ